MNNQRFHCHPSIILEKAGGFLIAWLLLLVSQADEILPVFLSGKFDPETLETILMFLAFMVVLPTLIAGYQFLVWKKTWICLEENTLVIERNTLNRKKDTYSIPHIANINTEQNLVELLLHTCRLKIDLENATDADSTDISIVLSVQKAQELKELLLSMRQGVSASPIAENEAKNYASPSEILIHCLCSLSGGFLVVLAALAGFFGFVLFQGDLTLAELLSGDEKADFSMQVLAIGLLVISYGYQIIKRLLMFYHFIAFRQGNDLIIRYGFFRKQDYTIPIKNIQALQIVQAPIARLFHLYEARVVCIGIGDSKEELTQLTLYCKKESLCQQLSSLLPEFSTHPLDAVHRPPKRAWKIYISSFLGWFICICVIPWLIASALADDGESWFVLGGIYGIVAVCLMVYHLFRFLCQGFSLGDSMALFSGGSLTKTVTLIPYRNIQHLCFKCSPVSSLLHLQKGSAHILASVLYQDVTLPYMETEDTRLLAEKLMQSTD